MNEPIICERCGAHLNSPEQYAYQDGHLYCFKCINENGTCLTCGNRYLCEFESNPSPLPKFTIQRIQHPQNPNMIMQTQVINAGRIEITCKKGCKCWGDELGCLSKDYGTCANYTYEI